MKHLLKFSQLVDALNEQIGKLAYWLVLLAVIISSGNALVRYAFNNSSNAWLEMQWYLFSAVFLFCGGYALLHNNHVRIDVVVGRFGPRAQAWVDLFGGLFFLLPMCLLFIYLSWPVFMRAYLSGEVSNNAGGLLLWPARLMVPIGFTLLLLQGVSETIKRAAFLQGLISDPNQKSDGPSLEEQLAEEIRKQRGETA